MPECNGNNMDRRAFLKIAGSALVAPIVPIAARSYVKCNMPLLTDVHQSAVTNNTIPLIVGTEIQAMPCNSKRLRGEAFRVVIFDDYPFLRKMDSLLAAKPVRTKSSRAAIRMQWRVFNSNA